MENWSFTFVLIVIAGFIGSIAGHFWFHKENSLFRSVFFGTIAAFIVPVLLLLLKGEQNLSDKWYIAAGLVGGMFYEIIFNKVKDIIENTSVGSNKVEKKYIRITSSLDTDSYILTSRRAKRVLVCISDNAPKTLADIVDMTGIKEKGVDRILKRLIKRGFVKIKT